MALHIGWRSFWWFNTGLIGLSLIMVVFMFPETKWHRTHLNELAMNSMEKGSNTSVHDSYSENSKRAGTMTSVQSADPLYIPYPLPLQRESVSDPWLGKGMPSKSQWGMYTPSPNPWKTMLLDLWVPWKLFAFPIVEFSSFVVSWTCSSFLTINLTQSQNFAAPPYNYDSQNIGFMNFAILVGAGIGLATAGPFSDWISARATKKNHGIREPEMRLPAMSKS